MRRQAADYDDVVVVVPAYNEAAVIKATLSNLLAHFRHVVCVDDGSSDDTYAAICSTNAIAIRHSVNLGQGGALQTAIEYALRNPRYTYFVTYDADGQHSIDDAMKMIARIRKEPVDIVLGSRFTGKTEGMALHRKVLLKLAVAFSNVTTGLNLTDAHNGLRVFNRKVAENLRITMPDMAHASEINYRVAERNFSYVEFPVTITYSDYSKAKGQSTLNSVNVLFDVLMSGMIKR